MPDVTYTDLVGGNENLATLDIRKAKSSWNYEEFFSN